ncbi:UNVERIFIED_CONTAM: hypothetical protein FKN15_069937 [Acipenser sinensis]
MVQDVVKSGGGALNADRCEIKDGTRMHLGLREQASGSAQCTFNTVREMVQDVVKSGGGALNADRCEKEIFTKIANFVVDRASTEKKFNEILSQYRTDILPDIVEGFNEFSETEKTRLSLLNELFCGLHLIDGLAHQANVTLSVWEGMIFGGDRVGSLRLGWMHGTADIEVHAGPVIEKLTEQSSSEFDEMTGQAVELILASLVKVCCRMLADHLEHGRYDEVSEELYSRLESAPKTNVSCERDFGIFDNLLRVKTRATGIALEGMIMFKENRSWQWLSSLDSEKKSEVLSIARASVKDQRAVFCERMGTIREARLQAMRDKKQQKIQKEAKDIGAKEQLTVELGKYGGLWDSEEDIDEQLNSLETSARINTVVAQLKFRRFVIGMKNENGIFNISKAGKKLSLEELTNNLKSVVCRSIGMAAMLQEERDYSSAPLELVAEEKAQFLKEAATQHVKARDAGRKKGGLCHLEFNR